MYTCVTASIDEGVSFLFIYKFHNNQFPNSNRPSIHKSTLNIKFKWPKYLNTNN